MKNLRSVTVVGLWLSMVATWAGAEVPRVVTDIAPVQGLVARVMQGVGAPSVLLPPGASPHTYALRPSNAVTLQNAQAIFYVSGKLEPWLVDAVAPIAGQARLVELLEQPGSVRLAFRDGAVFAGGPEDHEGQVDHDEHGDEAADDHDEPHDDPHGHAHEGLDPHAWLDPENGRVWLGVIADTLAALDPENAAQYRANAAAGQAELAALEREIAAELAPLTARHFVVYHDAYHYFEVRFGLRATAAIAGSDAAAPGPRRIARIRDVIGTDGVACVFSEPQFNRGLIDSVLGGGPARVALLDPLGTEIAPGAGFYPALIGSVADRIVQCLAEK
ncbi:zinc ABC transporter substrate-binding protein [Aquicoccus sp. G2-2]|uniref:zinc ABC transporter substrate-binding protein n=1 Tax=Aquicoccus sp. G2-2 TaxID=3092120 RepID=UPI002AE05DEC|nr:zinc ABC transporter substrate-binding protein [Aquicoccus sp. G2-2]MEA1112235.1 zinc ABC transporter substrate-binding protein [Aquicoccus sp. G2-2]